MAMTRMELHKKKRDEIAREAYVTASAKDLEQRVAKSIAEIDEISKNILAGYEQTGLRTRQLTVIDNTDRSAIERLRDYEKQIDQRQLSGVVELYEEKVARVMDRRSYWLSKSDGIVLKAAELSKDYSRYEALYESADQINLQQHIKLLESQQNFEKIDAIVARIAARYEGGKSLTDKENVADIAALDEANALVAARNQEAARQFVDEEFFSKVSVEAIKSEKRIQLRRWILLTSVLAGVLAVACVVFFALYAVGVV